MLLRRRRLGKRSKREVQCSPGAEENGECKESDDEEEVVAVEEEEEAEQEQEGGEQEQEEDDDDDADAMLPEEEEDGGDPEAVKYILGFEVEVIEDLRTAIEECGDDGDGETTTTTGKQQQQQQQQAARRGDDRIPGAADRFVEWVLSPLSLERFHSEFWERKPFLIRRPHNRSFYDGWFGKADIEKLLETQSLRYGVNLDVTKYEDGAQSTFSSDGDAKPSKVWKKFSKGWSVRILHPQRWSDPIFWMLSAFERYWRSVAGCNAYLTPPGSQGFSPHYDDIEAFVIQTEGKKHWKCYRPRSSSEVLPRFSSPNFEQLDLGKPILDVVLEAGDIL
jgi:lysine-specific demethylase/histidyl-hydroxylase NO66